MTVFEPFYQALAAMGYTEPVHPPMTHFPIALVTAALIFGVLGRVFKRTNLTISARHCLILAWLFILPTVLLGLTDWQHFYHGVNLVPIIVKIALASFLFVLLTAALVLVLRGRGDSGAVLAIYLLGFFTVVALGYFGGRLVYGGAPAPPGAPAAVPAGQRLFASHCSSCHSQGGNTVVPGQPLKGSDELDSFEKFLAFIRDPRLDSGAKGPMPDFPPSTLPDDQARELYEYLFREFGQPPAAPAQRT
jgi:mono/diheme cytochrome c family protein